MVGQAVEVLERAAGDVAGLSAGERRSVLAGVDGVIARLTAVRAGLLVAEREAGAWRAGGASSFAQFRGSVSGGGLGAAAREERQADALVGLPAVAAAARSGVIGLSHVDVIARVATDRSQAVREAVASRQGQAELVAMAQGQDAPSLARAAARWAAAHDPDALEVSHQAQRRARYLVLSPTDAGTRIRGQVDAHAGHVLRLALEAVTPRPAADDDRSGEQRAADALLTLAEATLADPSTVPGAAVRPHVSYLMREDTFVALRARRTTGTQSATRRTGAEQPSTGQPDVVQEVSHDAGAGQVPDQTGHDTQVAAGVPGWGGVLAVLEDGTPVPRSQVEQALCDCELTRIVVDADDVPVNLGRKERTYTGSQRRAVIARDRSCRWLGCAKAARWCQIHHIRWWERDGGQTSVTNGILLCSYHHHETHRRDLTINRLPPPPAESRQARLERQRRHDHERGRGRGRDDAREGEQEAGRSRALEHGDGAGSGDREGEGYALRCERGDGHPDTPGSASTRPDDDHRDASGGAGYRFIDSGGRVVAGPPWTSSDAVLGRVPALPTR